MRYFLFLFISERCHKWCYDSCFSCLCCLSFFAFKLPINDIKSGIAARSRQLGQYDSLILVTIIMVLCYLLIARLLNFFFFCKHQQLGYQKSFFIIQCNVLHGYIALLLKVSYNCMRRSEISGLNIWLKHYRKNIVLAGVQLDRCFSGVLGC